MTQQSSSRALRQWRLSKTESITSVKNRKNYFQYILSSLDPKFAPFLADIADHRRNARLGGFATDGSEVAEDLRKSAQQNGIASHSVISLSAITSQESSCMWSMLQMIHAHYGVQPSGAHFLALAEFDIEFDERPEDLLQRITSFVNNHLLESDGGVTHGGVVAEVEEISLTVDNSIALQWLRLLHEGIALSITCLSSRKYPKLFGQANLKSLP